MKDQRKYSGVASKAFWKRVDGLKYDSEVKHQELYHLGAILQNLEEHVLARLARVEGQ